MLYASLRLCGSTRKAARVICIGSYVSGPRKLADLLCVGWKKNVLTFILEPVNLKYTINSCFSGLYNNSTATLNACANACGGIHIPLIAELPQKNATQYQYCLEGSSFAKNADKCSECLSSQNYAVVLGNCMRSRPNTLFFL